jgi:hypothetical protein
MNLCRCIFESFSIAFSPFRVYYVPSTPERLRSSKFARPESASSLGSASAFASYGCGEGSSGSGSGSSGGDAGSEGELQICFHVKEAWNLNEVRCDKCSQST